MLVYRLGRYISTAPQELLDVLLFLQITYNRLDTVLDAARVSIDQDLWVLGRLVRSRDASEVWIGPCAAWSV